MRVVTVHTDGRFDDDDLDVASDLAWFQGQVGGFIEAVNLDSGAVALVNEDGHRLGLAVNDLATRVCAVLGRALPAPIVGPVVFIGGLDDAGENDGEFHSCPQVVLDALGALGASAG